MEASTSKPVPDFTVLTTGTAKDFTKKQRKATKKQAKKILKSAVKAAKKAQKKGTWFKGPKPKVTLERVASTLKSAKTVTTLAKLLSVSHTGAQNYIGRLRKAGYKIAKGTMRQGIAGPKAITFQVTASPKVKAK